MSRSTIVAEEVRYLPTYLTSDDGECSLFVRRFRFVQTPTGKEKLRIASDVYQYDDVDAMTSDVEENGWQELPKQAGGDHLFVPEDLAMAGVVVEQDYAR